MPTEFPSTLKALSAYDVVVLSDIGADSLLLHPDTFLRGQRTPNRLKLIAEWVEGGGGFMMVGGYLSFQGINGGARYRGTPIESDPAGAGSCRSTTGWKCRRALCRSSKGKARHPVLAGIRGPWPYLLGFNEVAPKPDATVLLKTSAGDDALPLLVVGTHGAGRTMAWTSDIGPHWLPETFSAWKGYGRLWRQAFGWLAGR